MRDTVDQPTDILRLPVPEVAQMVSIGPEAVRNRLQRGTLDREELDSTDYVLIDRAGFARGDDARSDRA